MRLVGVNIFLLRRIWCNLNTIAIYTVYIYEFTLETGTDLSVDWSKAHLNSNCPTEKADVMHNGVFLYIGVSIQGVSEKVHSWKKFTKVRRARNLRKRPVSLCTLTFSGTSSTKMLFKMLVFSSRKAVTNPSPPPNDTESQYGLSCTSYQSFKKFGARVRPTRDFQNLDFLPILLVQTRFLLHDFKLILCMLGFCINYGTKFASQFPKVLELLTVFIYKIIVMQCSFTNKINLQSALHFMRRFTCPPILKIDFVCK